mgnify:CR=1 FL=1
MSKIQPFDLISGSDVLFNDICVLHQPSLDEIRNLGYEQYKVYVNTLFVDLDTYLEKSDIRDKIDEELLAKLTMFDIWFSEDRGRALLKEALSFFIFGKLEEDLTHSVYLIYDALDNLTGFIDKTNYEDIQNAIEQLNFINSQEIKPKKFRNEAARKIYETIQKGKKEDAKTKKADPSMTLPNLIASVSSSHNSYNLINIWSLTVYQLYDQFFRLNNKIQVDTMSLKWAAWGTDSFDFSLWYKDLNLKEK